MYAGQACWRNKDKTSLKYNLIAGSDFPVVDNVDRTDNPWRGVLVLRTGGGVERDVILPPGEYSVEAVLKCFGPAACNPQLLVDGKVEAVFPVEPIDGKGIGDGWSVPSAQISVGGAGARKFRLQLPEGDNCAFHRLKVTMLE